MNQPFNEDELVMDQETTDAFQRVYDKIDTLACVEHAEKLAALRQWKDNGEKQQDTEIKKKGLSFSFDRLIVTMVVGGFGIWQILKEVLISN